MAMKCVHKGCGKAFTDEQEDCHYHSGPPEFHEGQKGWKCCKPRVLTFDEFLTIPPCTTGKHSTVDDTPAPPPKHDIDPTTIPLRSAKTVAVGNASTDTTTTPAVPRIPYTSSAQPTKPTTPAPPESESDEPSAPVPDKTTCRRRACGVSSKDVKDDRTGEECIYHPGQPIFHEGSKGWTCCKRRVLEFDEFLRIAGCKTRSRHCFVGKKKQRQDGEAEGEAAYEKVATVRHDFYQTSTLVHASIFLKKIDKDISSVMFIEEGTTVKVNLKTQDNKQYETTIPLYGKIDPVKSAFKVLGTKLEMTLVKADGAGWPVLRADEQTGSMIIQAGRAGNLAK